MIAALDDATVQPGRGRGWLIAYGLISIALGILAFIWPAPTTIAVTVYIGIGLVIAGVAALSSGAGGSGHESCGYDMLFGALTIAFGLMLIFSPNSGAVSLTLLIAIWLGVRGALEIYWGIKFKRHRWIMIGMGVLNILLDIAILATNPSSSRTLPGYILGASFLIGGIAAVTIARRVKPFLPTEAVYR